MGLDRLFGIVLLQRGEVFLSEPPALWVQVHRDRGAENGQSPAKGHDLLFMQPQQRTIHQAGHVAHLGPQQRIAVQRIEHRAKGSFHLNVLALPARGHLARQMRQKDLRALPPNVCGAIHDWP